MEKPLLSGAFHRPDAGSVGQTDLADYLESVALMEGPASFIRLQIGNDSFAIALLKDRRKHGCTYTTPLLVRINGDEGKVIARLAWMNLVEHREQRERLDALGPAPRAELVHVLMLPDFDRADRIGEFWGNPKTRTFAELLIDCEEDRTLRAVLVWMLRKWRANRRGRRGASLLEVPGPAALGEHGRPPACAGSSGLDDQVWVARLTAWNRRVVVCGIVRVLLESHFIRVR